MADIYIEFSAGRRGVNDPECRWCGRDIHLVPDLGNLDRKGDWCDGHGKSRNNIPGSPNLLDEHAHEPAKEEGPTLGPFDFQYVQITYDTLRHESETIAYYDRDRGDWIIAEPWTGAGEAYSDITIMAKED